MYKRFAHLNLLVKDDKIYISITLFFINRQAGGGEPLIRNFSTCDKLLSVSFDNEMSSLSFRDFEQGCFELE